MAVKSVFAPNEIMLLIAYSFTFNACVVTHIFLTCRVQNEKYLSIMNLPMYTVLKIILSCLFWSSVPKGGMLKLQID